MVPTWVVDDGKLVVAQERFRELHEADEMAVDKLAQGIENFAADQRLLEAQLAKLAGGGLHAH